MRDVKTVVLLIDTIRGFHDIGNLANSRMANIIPNIKKLLTDRNEPEIEFILLADCHEEDDKEFEIFPPHCIVGTAETRIIDELSVPFFKVRGTYSSKTTFSSFYETDLEENLLRWNPEQIIVVGVCTDICVLSIAMDLKARGYKVIVPRNCVETYDAPGHPAEKFSGMALEIMKTVDVEVVDSIE